MNKPHNIVAVISHDLGQHLGCYGVSHVRSGNIDGFAAGAIRFEKSFCTAPQCSPSRAALWTGRFAHSNGVVGLTQGGFANDLNPDEKHLAQILREAGWETRLFGIQHEARSAERCGYERVHAAGPCGKVAADFAEFIAQRGADGPPLFAQIGFSEPHRPFPHHGVEPLPPDTFAVPPYLPDIPEVREDLSHLEASIASMDKAFGVIVEAVRLSALAGDTILLFTTDHGIAFPRAKMTLYDPGIEAALILSVPGAPRGVVREDMISNVDVVPTLLDFLLLPHPPNLQGQSFRGLIAGGAYTAREAVFAEKTYHAYYDPMRAIRTKRWKLIANFECAPWQETPPDYLNNAKGYVEVAKALKVPSTAQFHPPFELYDLANDPSEQRNLADDPERRPVRDDLIRSLRKWMEETKDPLLDGPMAQGAYRERMTAFKGIGQPTRRGDP